LMNVRDKPGRESLPAWSRSAVDLSDRSQLACSCLSTKMTGHGRRTDQRSAVRRYPAFMALTFGTLLSSQGTDTHRSGPLGRSRGNSLNLGRLRARVKPAILARSRR